MGKTYRYDDDDVEYESGEQWVDLNDIYIGEGNKQGIHHRDAGQIDQMCSDYEWGKGMVRVVLRCRIGGGYNIEDGRHRVLSAKQAGVGFIKAFIRG